MITDLEKLEYIHSTLQELCNHYNISYLYEIETSIEFVEELREPHLKRKGDLL